MTFLVFLVIYAFICLLGNLHAAKREREGKHPGLFFDFWRHTAWNVHAVPLLLLALSALLTWGMVVSGWDRDIQIFFQKTNPLGQTVPWIVLMGGSFWHMALALAVYFRGVWRKNLAQMGAGLAGAEGAAAIGARGHQAAAGPPAGHQALLVTLLVNTTEKMLSGRRGPASFLDDAPRHHAPFVKTRNPADFSFDFWNHGHANGRFFWPSGHTAAIFAFVAALRTYYPEKRWIPWVGYPFCLFTALSMVDGDFHWASDVVAGAILGEVLGRFVGRGFKKRYRRIIA